MNKIQRVKINETHVVLNTCVLTELLNFWYFNDVKIPYDDWPKIRTSLLDKKIKILIEKDWNLIRGNQPDLTVRYLTWSVAMVNPSSHLIDYLVHYRIDFWTQHVDGAVCISKNDWFNVACYLKLHDIKIVVDPDFTEERSKPSKQDRKEFIMTKISSLLKELANVDDNSEEEDINLMKIEEKSKAVYDKMCELEFERKESGRSGDFEKKYAEALKSTSSDEFFLETIARHILGYKVPEDDREGERIRMAYYDLRYECFQTGSRAFNQKYRDFLEVTKGNEEMILRKKAVLYKSKMFYLQEHMQQRDSERDFRLAHN